ncbi:hypothetical protein BsWGS_25609 [Bradybaena similaris]
MIVFSVVFSRPIVSVLTGGKASGVQNAGQPIKNTVSMAVSDSSILTKASSVSASETDGGRSSPQEVSPGGMSKSSDIADILVRNKTEPHIASHLDRSSQLNLQQGVHSLSRNNSQKSPPALTYQMLIQSKDKEYVPDDTQSTNKEPVNGFLKSVHDNIAKPKSNERNKFYKVDEKSKSLMERLCNVSKSSKKYVCYQQGSSTCYCRGGLADCSGRLHAPNVGYAPKFKADIKCLNLAFNNIHLSDSFFANVSDFVAIDVSYNKLQKISKNTFSRFTNLKYLILNNNDLDKDSLRPVFSHPPSLRLDIVGLDLEDLPPDYFVDFPTIPTAQIYMDLNYIHTLDLRLFVKLKKLEYLSVTFSNIQKVISAPLCNLKGLYLDNNSISDFPNTCSNAISKNDFGYDAKYECGHLEQMRHLSEETKQSVKKVDAENTSLFPRLKELYMGHNNILSLPPKDQLCLPAVVTLNLQTNNITEISGGTFTNMRSLKAIHLDRMNTPITKIGPSAFNISSLTSLYLSKNKIPFASKDVNTTFLQGCDHLHVLSIDHNNLNGMTENMFEELLNNTPSLKYIYLSSTEMQIIPVTAFSRLQKLEKLFIYVNAIKEIPPGAFDNMLSLRFLYMDENQISNIKENAFSPDTRQRLQLINLSKNPYLCDCDLLWFRSWLIEAGDKQFMNFSNYQCTNMLNVSVQSYSWSKQACLFSQRSYILFIVCLSIIIVFTLVFAVLYRYRWNIRLMMYERRASRRNRTDVPGDFQYDLFVVHCNDDWDWVEEALLPVLETKWNLKTCIHQRDFVAGRFIIDNIVEAMNASRRILVVISSQFSHSRWCNFELQLVQSQMIEHDLPSLLVIVLDEIEARDMRAPMLALYNTTCCLEWPTDSRLIFTFWKRLEKSLGLDKRPNAASDQVEMNEMQRDYRGETSATE